MAVPAPPAPPTGGGEAEERRPFCFLPQREPEAAAGAARARSRVVSSSARLASTMLSVRVVAALGRALPRQAGLVSDGDGKGRLYCSRRRHLGPRPGGDIDAAAPSVALRSNSGPSPPVLSFGARSFSASLPARGLYVGLAVTPARSSLFQGPLQPGTPAREGLRPLDGSEKRARRPFKPRCLFWDGFGRAAACQRKVILGGGCQAFDLWAWLMGVVFLAIWMEEAFD